MTILLLVFCGNVDIAVQCVNSIISRQYYYYFSSFIVSVICRGITCSFSTVVDLRGLMQINNNYYYIDPSLRFIVQSLDYIDLFNEIKTRIIGFQSKILSIEKL